MHYYITMFRLYKCTSHDTGAKTHHFLKVNIVRCCFFEKYTKADFLKV